LEEELIARIFQVVLALAGAYLVALWFALIIWTYRDITTRSTNPVTHVFSTLIVVLFFVPGAIIYLILRPKETLDEAFQRTMEEEYLLQDLDDFPVCPSCRRAVRDDFVYCPHCSEHLRGACITCRRLIDRRWDVCPYCGSVQTEEAAIAEPLHVPSREPARATRAAASGLQTIDGGRLQPAARQDDADTPVTALWPDEAEPNGSPRRARRQRSTRAATTRSGADTTQDGVSEEQADHDS
jgi:RNA polymerase subunit RPABC4/transcription elongation factor Spt4